MGGPLEFWYEFASTYSYPAALRVEVAAEPLGIKVVWKPFLLGPIFQDLGWTTSPFNLQPAKGAYMWRDLERSCAQLGLPFLKPTVFPQNGLMAARIATALPDENTRSAFTRAVYTSQFALGQDISDHSLLAALLEQSGQNPAQIMARATSQQNKDALKERTEQARAHGIFGAPTWRTSDGELFWGNDRLDDALNWQANTVGKSDTGL